MQDWRGNCHPKNTSNGWKEHHATGTVQKNHTTGKVLKIKGWETDSEELISLETSEGGETKSKHIISPILQLYVDMLIIDHASRDHSIINIWPQTMSLDCLFQQKACATGTSLNQGKQVYRCSDRKMTRLRIEHRTNWTGKLDRIILIRLHSTCFDHFWELKMFVPAFKI